VDTEPQTSFSSRIRACSDELACSGISALGRLYDLTSQRLVRYAWTLTGNQHDAEDATQAALVRVAMNPRAMAGARYPWPYLLRMVRNESLMILRRKRRLQLTTMADLAIESSAAGADQDQQRQVWQAIRQLPASQAEVVVLKIWEEMTFAQIGRVLGTSPNTVASRYQYAIAKLARSLQSLKHEASRD
jgi:RNA polymerase sigma-70 factor (ECF subfamily)